MKNSVKLKNQRGFTLIEIAIVLTIVGLVIGGIWLAASTVTTNNKSRQAQEQAVQIIQSIKNGFASQTGAAPATGVTTTVAKNAGWFPASSVRGGFTSHAFVSGTPSEDTIKVAAGASSGAGNTILLTFGTTTNKFPVEACGALASTLSSSSNINSLAIKQVNGSAVAATTTGNGANQTTTSSSYANAVNSCAGTTFTVEFGVP